MSSMPDRPSILFLNRVYPPDAGATGRMLRDLAQAFAKDGWRVTVLATGARGSRGTDGPVTVRRAGVGRSRKSMFGYGIALARLLSSGLSGPRPDIVVSMTDPPLLILAGRLIARARKARHVHWSQDVYPDLLPVLGYDVPPVLLRILTRLNTASLRSCDRVVAIGRCMARTLLARGATLDRLTVIPNWSDAELAPAVAGAREATGKFRVLYAGTLGRAHPVEALLHAARLLKDTHPQVEFLFVGEGDGYDRLARDRMRFGLDTVRQLPRQPVAGLAALMASGDLHVVTMEQAARGLLVPCKLYAAFGAGRPVLLAGPENSEAGMVIREYGCGQIVPPDAPEAIAAAIARYADDAEAWQTAATGAAVAGAAFRPAASTEFWIARARALLPAPPVTAGTVMEAAS